jgi:hypothetical protein
MEGRSTAPVTAKAALTEKQMTKKTLDWIRIATLASACMATAACDEPPGDEGGMEMAEDTDGMEEGDSGAGAGADTEPDSDSEPEPEPEPKPDSDSEPEPEPDDCPSNRPGCAGTSGPDPDQPPMADDDGDGADNPAVLARFRATSGAPLRVEGAIFNETPLDVQGLQYADAVSVPGDDLDVVAFDIVPGEVDPTIRIGLDCDLQDAGRLTATLVRDGNEVIDTIVCGEGDVNVLLPNASSLDQYTVEVQLADAADALTAYELSVNGFCFQQCNYALYGM